MRLAVRSLALVVPYAVGLLACGARPGISHDVDLFAANAARTAFAYVVDGQAVLVRGDQRLRAKLTGQSCFGGHASTLFVFPDGKRVVVFGSESKMGVDPFGHAGRHVSVSCLVDFEAGTATELGAALPALPQVLLEARATQVELVVGPTTGRLYGYRPHDPGDGIDVVDASGALVHLVPEGDHGVCRVGENSEHVIVACVSGSGEGAKTLTVLRYGLAFPPERVSGASVVIEAYEESPDLVVSADGRRVAYWGRTRADLDGPFTNTLGVVDVESGQPRFATREPYGGAIAAVELDPRGSGELLVADWMQRSPDDLSMTGRVRHLDAEGHTRATHAFADAPTRLAWATPGLYWYDSALAVQRVPLP